MSTFVSVGNAKQSFNRLLAAVQEAADLLPVPVVVQHGHNQFVDARFETIDFMTMEDFQQAVASAKLVILHGGAGSVITALKIGKTPLVMARRPELGEHVDHHQLEFVEELAKAGKIISFHDQKGIKAAIEKVLAVGDNQVPEQYAVPEIVGLVRYDLAQIAKKS